MTSEEYAKDWSRRVGNEHYCGAECQEKIVAEVVAEAIKDEREGCAVAVENFGRSAGRLRASHKHAARAIRERL